MTSLIGRAERYCCKCGMEVGRLMFAITLNSDGPSPVERVFCPPCFQDTFALNEEDMAQYLSERIDQKAIRFE